MANDLRLAIRMLTRAPLFTLICVLSMAFGIGSASTIFNWMDRVLWRPLPGVAAQERLVGLVNRNPAGEWMASSYPDYRDYRDRAKTLASVAAFRWQPVFVGGPGDTQRAYSQSVSGNFFDTLGVKPLLGRTFSADEQGEKPAPVVVLAERYWERRFARDPQIVGRDIQVNRQPLRVVGIVGRDFSGAIPGLDFDLWIPLNVHSTVTGFRGLDDRANRPLSLLARLAPGATLAQANAEVSLIGRQLEREYARLNDGVRMEAVALGNHPDGAQRVMREPLYAMAALSLVILLLVCANVGNLLMARGQSRRQEFAVRRSLGASAWDIARQVWAETAVLCLAGAGLGMLMAVWMGSALTWLGTPTGLPLRMEASFTGRLAVMTLLAGCAAAILASLAPILRSQAADLRESSRSATGARGLLRWRGSLAAAEIALATIALVAGLVFWRSFEKARAFKPGFDPEGIVLVGLDPIERNATREQAWRSLERSRQALAQLPGAESAVLMQHTALGLDMGSWETVEIPGYLRRRDEAMNVWRNLVSPGYFATLRIPLMEGRDFNDLDTTEPVAIVNETFARRFYAGRSAIGQELVLFGGDVRARVVGVAKDSKYHTIAEAPKPFFYLPMRQRISPAAGVAIAVRGDPRLLESIQRNLNAIDPAFGVIGPVAMETFLGSTYIAQSAAARLFTALGIIAVLLAAMGIYGVMAFAAVSRRREMGIRMAIGARPADAIRLLMSNGLRWATAGIAAGVLGWFAVSPAARALLFGVDAADPWSLGWALAAIFAILAAAIALPAWRASRVEPGVALRETA